MENCIFCGVVSGKIASDKILETPNILVIEDKFPQAPKHYLVLPKKHITDVMGVGEEDNGIIAELVATAQETARKKGLDKNGFRMVINHGHNGGQTIFHLHIHLLGGRQMHWPPG